MDGNRIARFPLSKHVFRPHVEGGQAFGNMPSGYSPSQLLRVYGFDGSLTGEGVKIGIVSAFDNAATVQNARVFCRTFSLPEPKISLYYPDGRTEGTSRRWLTESGLDTQWAHVFAPLAEICVVFSRDAQTSSLLSAARYARDSLFCDVVCMCFGTEESASDDALSSFMADGGIFVASSGDVGGMVSFPSSSPYCISVGGTNLKISPSGKRVSETAWKNGGGGKSDVFSIPFYQGRFFNLYGMTDGMRGIPDVAMSASFAPGAPVYISQLGGWTVVGGTSLAAACFCGICALIKQMHPEISSGTDILSYLYSKAGGDGYAVPQYSFYDITVGKAGENYAEKGWDFVSGLGSPIIKQLVL